ELPQACPLGQEVRATRGGDDPGLERRAPRAVHGVGPPVVLRVAKARLGVPDLRARHGHDHRDPAVARLAVRARLRLLRVERPTGEALEAAALHEAAARVTERDAVLAARPASLLVSRADLARHEPRA